MCRLALINKPGIQFLEETTGLRNFFDELEESFGGHGNGIALIKKDGYINIKKGVKLNNQKITSIINSEYKNIEYVIYHTRLASKGVIKNSNCHPFRQGNNVLVMNGTEHSVDQWISKDETDTETILKLAIYQNLNLVDVCSNFKSAFLGLFNNKVFATHSNSSDLEIVAYKNILIFASEFPANFYVNKNFKVYNAPKTWIEGEKIDLNLLTEKRFKPYNYLPIRYTYPVK